MHDLINNIGFQDMIMNQNNSTFSNCYDSTEDEDETLKTVGLWIEGVLPIVIGVPGIIGNVVASVILSRKSMRNSFNFLLIALAIYDSCYIFLDILQKRKELHTSAYIILFPYLLYPLEMIAMTGSILLTVAIALERYTAVHYPISYRQTLKNADAMKKRVATYLIPMTIICISFNVTKFLELSYQCEDLTKIEAINNQTLYFTKLAMKDLSFSTNNHRTDQFNNDLLPISKEAFDQELTLSNDTTCDENTISRRYQIIVNEFRKTPAYGIYFNCFRFVCIGVIPFVLLVVLNARIYSDLQKRQIKKASNAVDKNGDQKEALANKISDTAKIQVQSNKNDEAKITDQEQIELAPLVKKTSNPASNFNMSTKKKEDQMRGQDRALAFIMMGYVMVFLICHSPRLLLNIYELATVR